MSGERNDGGLGTGGCRCQLAVVCNGVWFRGEGVGGYGILGFWGVLCSKRITNHTYETIEIYVVRPIISTFTERNK